MAQFIIDYDEFDKPISPAVSGVFRLAIYWEDQEEEDLIIFPIKSFSDAMRILNRYLKYESFSIDFVPFANPERY